MDDEVIIYVVIATTRYQVYDMAAKKDRLQ